MSSHLATPLYRDAYSLALLVARSAPKMPKDFKALYGSELKMLTLGMLRDVRLANAARDQAKLKHIDNLLQRVEDTNDLLRITRDLGHLSNTHYASGAQLTGSVGRQAGGLRKKYAPVA